jgi:hypothetical protein
MSFVSGRRFPSRFAKSRGLRNQRGEQKKEQFCCEKREEQSSFFAEREFLVLLSLVAYLTLSRETSLHTQKLSLFNIPKTDKTHLYGEQEESDRTRVSRDHQ